MATQKPNLIYVFADQLRYQSCGYAGDPLAHTPNIDRLATQGANFHNAVVSMPVCAATRASMFTGKHTTSTGMVINELRMNPNHRCLGHCLKDGGYDTAYIGKWHLYANELGNHDAVQNAFVPPGPHRLGFDGYWAGYNFHHQYYGAYYFTDKPEKIHFPPNVYEPDGQTDLAIEYMNARRSDGEPFAMFLSFGTPHDPWEPDNVPDQWYNMFANTNFPLAATYRDEPDAPYGDAWSDEFKTPELINQWKRCYYAMTANLDSNLGRLMEAIEQAGLAENTILIFSSDHGEMWGAHGRMKKNIFYEEAARVPMLMRWPGRIPPGHVSDACFNSVDIMPTLLGFLGLDIPDEVEGMNLSHAALGEPGPEPEFAFLQNTGACASWENGHEWRALRDKRYTYAIYKIDGKELLFDNIADPLQAKNIADDPGQRERLIAYRAKLAAKMREINDTFEDSLWYKEHWISEDRRILRSATMNPTQ